MCDGNAWTIMPSMLDTRSAIVSDREMNSSNQPLMQSQITSEPSTSSHDYRRAVTLSQAPYRPQSDPSYSFYGQTPREFEREARPDVWNTWVDEPYERHEPTTTFVPSPIPQSSPFQPGYDNANFMSCSPSTRRPTLPLPTRSIPQSLWTESPFGSPLQQLHTVSPSSSPSFLSYDEADHLGPTFQATTSGNHVNYQQSIEYDHRSTVERTVSCDTDDEIPNRSEPPYAKLIYQALMATPGHRLVLKDIYNWISENTDKAKDPAFKGWQNSVRHNLSMNGAFKKEPYSDPSNKSKKGFIWVLEESAIEKGIESTTRYRQKTIGKKVSNPQAADPKRQRSGRKGGKAARRTGRLLEMVFDDPRRSFEPQEDSEYYRMGPDVAFSTAMGSYPEPFSNTEYSQSNSYPYWPHTPPLSVRSSLPDHPYYSSTDGMSESQMSNCSSYDTTSEIMLPFDPLDNFDDHVLSDRLSSLH